MRRKSVTAGVGGSGSNEQYNPYDATSSQGFLVRMVNKILFRNGPNSIVNRLLRGAGKGIDGVDVKNRLLTGGKDGGAGRQLRNSKRQSAALSADALLSEAPAIGTAPSLLSGFTAFLQTEHSHGPRKGHSGSPAQSDGLPGRGQADECDIKPPIMSVAEFEAMLARTPAEMIAEVLAERKEEYSEYLRRLETARRQLVQRLKEVDDRIMSAVTERKEIADRLAAAEDVGGQPKSGGSSPDSKSNSKSISDDQGNSLTMAALVEDISDDGDDDDDAGVYEQDDVPRLRKLDHLFRGHYGAVTALDSDPDMGLIASGSLDTQVRVWDSDTGACKYVIRGHNDIIRGVQFYDRFLLTAANDHRVRMWDLSLLDSVQPQPSTMIMREEYMPSSRRPANEPNVDNEDDNENENENGPTMAMTLQSTTPPMTPTICRPVPPLDLCCENAFIGHTDAVTCFQANNGTLISGSADKTVREWDLTTGMLRQTIDITWATRDSAQSARLGGGSYGPPTMQHRQPWGRAPLSFSTGDLLSSPSARGTDYGNGGFIGALQFYDFALATGSADGALRLWDLRTAQPHRQLFGHSQPITSLRFDDRSVLTGSLDGLMILWDLRTGQALQKVAFGGPVSSAQLVMEQRGSGSGKQSKAAHASECWVAAADSSLHRYNANSMQHVRYASDYGLMNSNQSRDRLGNVSSGTSMVTRIHCQDKSSVVVSGDSDGIVKLWSI
ncbi:Mitochondrial fission protein [Kickxella alabastrina]|uniref:Mitochondrial fission protein n=1 Tax=Kickxella alabastrina TaxID=61397 RepID=A0ACC1IPC9_9FUNG|nr:Mitochondrial fission protein [Kickxella alabastrina]